ncbi:MAG: chromosome segregation protein SMC [Gemmatimonadaceae bacterium]|nr:chromosome segregation protein SMC [Gemmatimonadaceae bacterium]
MRLTKLELHGFKSFADPVFLTFDHGATAIVGPNGCGKSNVSDAVRWVLGEQRARLLRGGKMEDVIFQGSSARRATNIAEVSLHFENEDGQLPVPFKEVVITRRLSRSGESDYFLNRAPCRLRDIHDLVRGTGLGADSGVVIESKMIDALLSDRPDDRRELFEEAAGVGLYRDRRRTTERQLEATSADLIRIDDLMSEVQTQVRSLLRQRNKAEKSATLTARRFSVELTLASREMAAWQAELADLESRLGSLREALPTRQQAVRDAEVARDAAQASRAAAETQRHERAAVAATARQAVLELQQELAVAEERHRNALTRRERAQQEQAEGAAFGDRLKGEAEAAAAEESQCATALHEANDLLRQRVQAEEQARQGVVEARNAADAADRGVRELRDQSRRLELERENAERELAEVAQRSEALVAEHEALADRLGLAERELQAADESLAIAKEASDAADAALQAARAAARDAREREGAARADVRRIEEEHTALQGRLAALERLEKERVGLAPAAARLIRERERFAQDAILGPLSDFIGADAEAAVQIERFLGASVHAVVVRDRAAADAVRAWHAEVNPGALLLLPLDSLQAEGGNADPSELAARVRAEGAGSGWVRALLGKVRATGDGNGFVDARGAMWLPARDTGAGPLARRAELDTLRASLATVDTRRADVQARAQQVHNEVVQAEASAAQAADGAAAAQQQLAQAAQQRGERDRVRERAARELADAVALREKLAGRHTELGDRVNASLTAQDELARRLTEADESAGSVRGLLAAAERAQDEARESRAAQQVAHAQAEARRQVAAERRERLERERNAAQDRLAALEREMQSLAEQDGALEQQMTVWQQELESRRGSLAEAEQALAEAEATVRDTDTELADAGQALDSARADAGSANETLHHAELRHTELAGRRTAIRERLEAEWRRPLDELFADYQPVEAEDDALRIEAEDLRKQLESLGPVNPLAIEEHEEETKRLEFLTTQRADLTEAQAKLTQAIKEIDVTARDLFLATFAQVRAHFREIFMTLFGGGECDLRLEDPDKPLDCDIEIHASPRGKRTQRIHLLSSGERALVALSLLFGIFLTKPSPFCLLDEVDAPLDDQNIGRFVRMLNEFKKKTQFIVITHNPRTTTEAADAVYGVTMQEPGVSSLVSVRMRGGPAVDEDAA